MGDINQNTPLIGEKGRPMKRPIRFFVVGVALMWLLAMPVSAKKPALKGVDTGGYTTLKVSPPADMSGTLIQFQAPMAAPISAVALHVGDYSPRSAPLRKLWAPPAKSSTLHVSNAMNTSAETGSGYQNYEKVTLNSPALYEGRRSTGYAHKTRIPYNART